DAYYSGAAANNDGTAEIDNSIELGGVAISESDLDATVSNNQTGTLAYGSDTDSANEVGGAFGGVSGISVAAQNVGQASAVQQSVNVQSNIGSGAADGSN
ncbi:MAG: hypothetical protein KJO01_04060, partial [Gammaproteobacteria bacterium]|nr:hypothetical protein [Gammaproteobacteria bacterium]